MVPQRIASPSHPRQRGVTGGMHPTTQVPSTKMQVPVSLSQVSCVSQSVQSSPQGAGVGLGVGLCVGLCVGAGLGEGVGASVSSLLDTLSEPEEPEEPELFLCVLCCKSKIPLYSM